MQVAQRLAERQALDVDRIANTSGKLVGRIYEKLKRNIRNREWKVSFHTDEDVLDLYTDILARAFLKRYQIHNRRKKKARRVGLAVPDLRDLAEQFDIDLGSLKRQLRPLAKRSLKRSVKTIESTLQEALNEVLGQPPSQALRQVTKRLHSLGVTPVNDSFLKTLIKTNSAITYNAAEQVRFSNDISLWGYQYVTVGDDRVRPSHAALDGVRRKKDDKFWDTFWPPNGYNCRCQVIPIYGESRQTPVPNVKPDEGFDFNPRSLISV